MSVLWRCGSLSSLRQSYRLEHFSKSSAVFPSGIRCSTALIPSVRAERLYCTAAQKEEKDSGEKERPPPWERQTTPEEASAWENAQTPGGQGFPDWIEKWNRRRFFQVGTAMLVPATLSLATLGPLSLITWCFTLPVGAFWWIGLRDINQKKHTIRRNFPVMGNTRYFLETLRPEVRQYFVESDNESSPFSRHHRNIVYARSKNMQDTLPFGTRRDVYQDGYEWVSHSMFPTVVKPEYERVTIGGKDCTEPYSASLYNVSAMSYGALSDNAILALNTAAEMGNFYHNTGEGGVSRFHLEPGGDIVWNVGTGYFGCREIDGTFSSEKFKETATSGHIKMIELKLSQGAKPGHGGILPGSKLTQAIAEARGVPMNGQDVVSPPRHSAFQGARGLVRFIGRLRILSGGKPIGMKMCVGDPVELAAIVCAMKEEGITPDFITVDGGEGGTGAAPPEFSNSVGMPVYEGLWYVKNLLLGAGLRDQVKIIAAGKIVSGFALVKMLALGADVCNSARAMMMALGCIQALKCNTNKCPTGVATQDASLMKGLDVEDKSRRVYRYHKRTIHTAMELIGAIGMDNPAELRPKHILRRKNCNMISYHDIYPEISLPFPSGERIGTQVVSDEAYNKLLPIWQSGELLLKCQDEKFGGS